MNDIDVKTYDPFDFVPRGIVNLVEGRQLPSATDEPWKVCLIGASLFPGSLAPANVPVLVRSEKPAETSDTTVEAAGRSAVELFGAGSELHLMCRAAFRAFPGVELWAAPIEISEDDGAVTAWATLTATGAAARTGEWIIVIHDTPVRARIEDGSDPRATLEAIAAALNAAGDLPIAVVDPETHISEGAVPGSSVLTITAKHAGGNGNHIDIYRKGGTAGQSLTVARFQGGSGFNYIGSSKETDPEGALAELAKQRFHYIVVANTDTGAGSNLDELRDHLERLAEPIEGKRQQALYGWTGSLEDAIGDDSAGGTAWVNSARVQCVWSQGSSLPPGELAAAVAAHRAWMEGAFAAANTVGQTVVGVPRPRLPSDLPDHLTLNEALHQGVTPLDVKGTGMALVRSVTTRFLGSPGAAYELLDTVKVTVSDFVADDVALKLQARFGGFKLAPDTDVSAPARTATPASVRRALVEWVRGYEASGLLRNVDAHMEEIRVEIDEEAPGRMNFELPEAVVDICAVTAGNLIRF